ncbi:Peptide methionine sulfoxide reductase MrsB [Trinorchestia longiramus]|nr:Peptide methionine sulfoxide reductase MrsB [Trinorchestia longiramus]
MINNFSIEFYTKCVYVCVECGHPLFSSRTKFDHPTPWPAFTKTIKPDSVNKVPEENRPNALKVSCGKSPSNLCPKKAREPGRRKSLFQSLRVSIEDQDRSAIRDASCVKSVQ